MVTGVPAAAGEIVEVIVIRGADDVERYARAPVTSGDFSDHEDSLGVDGEVVFDAIRELTAPPSKPRLPIGFERSDEVFATLSSGKVHRFAD
jgi:hypothetical protein